jgi:hypothetical protein
MNITIISHRRSGTHLTIDLIRNNFSNFSMPYVSFDELSKRKKIDFEKYRIRSQKSQRIYKSHSDKFYKEHYTKDYIADFFEHILSESKIIYVCRNLFDVQHSLYFHYKKFFPKEINNLTLYEFSQMKNSYHSHSKIENDKRYFYWYEHIMGWQEFNAEVLFLSYDSILNNYENTICRIADFLGEEDYTKKDVRLSKPQNIIRDNSKISSSDNIKRTSVNYKQGISGIGRSAFTIEQKKNIRNQIINKYGTLEILDFNL